MLTSYYIVTQLLNKVLFPFILSSLNILVYIIIIVMEVILSDKTIIVVSG